MSVEEARQGCSFNIDVMSQILLKDWNPRWEKFQEIVAKDPILRNDVSEYGSSREKTYEIYAKKAYRLHKLINYSQEGIPGMVNSMFPETIVTVLHQTMFIPTIKNLATEKQLEKWLIPSIECKVIGCYAQTELGHGSDVQNLETTATYDKKTEEFIINSPTVTATKWWVGDLGFTANHCVTHAQLYIDGKHYGIQTFIVPLRDIQTHKHLPGVTTGDIGPKYGYNTKDNGWARFENVRIPRENMLMKYSKVSKTGEFIKSQNEKIGYATMMQVRLAIIANTAVSLGQGLAIAIPYSHFRRQFVADGAERQIIDYQTQQDKLTPLVADLYGQMFGMHRIQELLHENVRRVNEKADFSLMGDLHGLLCCTKAVYTWTTHFGLEKIRQSCGGHGYLQSAGIVTVLTEFSPSCTYEGENTVLLLQTGRYLMKALSKTLRNQAINDNVEYLHNISATLASKATFTNAGQLRCPETVRKILRVNAAFRVFKAAQLFQEKSGEVGPKDAVNKHVGIAMTEAAIAHTHYWTTKTFLDTLMRVSDESVRTILANLCCLYGIQKIIDTPAAYFESGYLNGNQLELILQVKEDLLAAIKPDLVGLTDAMKFHPNTLRSDLIAPNPYKALLESAEKSQTNCPEFQKRLNQVVVKMQLNPKL